MTKIRQAQQIAVELRKKYHEGKLSPSQIESLRNVGFDFEVVDTVAENKAKLLEMARNGESRPNLHKHPLGYLFASYIRKDHNCYDPEFEMQVGLVAPSWIAKKSDIVSERKRLLIEMAKNGEPRPNQRSGKLGRCLQSYVTESHIMYDVDFYCQLMQVNPSWFIMPSNIAKQKKELLLQMAKNGDSRPQGRVGLAKCLSHYVDYSGRCYDAEFSAAIRKLAPHWFRKEKKA